tara:strand:- start:731 stop:1105 length:375 start_codon:yes stop_codon:yes gene_type:complete
MAEKYLYFRGDATIGNDDDAADGSNLYPLSSFRGMESVSDTTITMFFAQKHNSFASHDDAAFGKNDRVTLTVGTNDQKNVMKEIAVALSGSESAFIIVADDVAGEYLVSGVTAVSDFTVQGDQA